MNPDDNEDNEPVMLKYEVKKIYLQNPIFAYRKICEHMERKGLNVTPKKIRRIMKKMGLKAIYSKPSLSKPGKGHKIYPYLLKGLEISYPNHVWATGITYIKVAGPFVCLVAILDFFSRRVLAWRLSNTADADFCMEALEEAIDIYGVPEIFNTDQGSQFTSEDFTEVLGSHKIRISMDGKGRALDNVYVERLWRSLKYENIFIKEYRDLKELKGGVKLYFRFYNTERVHQSLGYQTPDEVYFSDNMLGFESDGNAA